MSLTKHHKNSQITDEQRQAMYLLLQGRPDREIAEQIGVARETITRWRNHDPFFQAALNQARRELWEGAQDKLRGLIGKAVDTLEKALEENNVKAAVEVLKAAIVYGNVRVPDEVIGPELVLCQQARQWAEAEFQRQNPSQDPLTRPVQADAVAELARKRLQELRREYLASLG
jgi:Homeodomain-like domain